MPVPPAAWAAFLLRSPAEGSPCWPDLELFEACGGEVLRVEGPRVADWYAKAKAQAGRKLIPVVEGRHQRAA